MLLVFLGLRSGTVKVCILLGCCDAASHWVFGASVSRQRTGLLLKGWNVHSTLEDEIMLCWNVGRQRHCPTSMGTGTVNVTSCCAFWRDLVSRCRLLKNAQWTLQQFTFLTVFLVTTETGLLTVRYYDLSQPKYWYRLFKSCLGHIYFLCFFFVISWR